VKRTRDGSGSGSGGAPATRVKREGGPGRCGGGAHLRPARAQDAPVVVCGREVRRDEVAFCDLVDSDGDERAVGRWEVRKKPVVEVTSTTTGGTPAAPPRTPLSRARCQGSVPGRDTRSAAAARRTVVAYG
jgi:hypothetical protein